MKTSVLCWPRDNISYFKLCIAIEIEGEALLYLIPDWHQDTELEEDRIYTLSNFFSKQEFENKLLLTKKMSFLRYKLNEIGYRYDNVISIFDILQNISIKNGHPISLEDLSFSSELERIYTPNSVSFLKDNVIVAVVYFNDFGFVSSVRHHLPNGDFIEDIYDDRGFISIKRYLDKDGKPSKTAYYNEQRKKTLTQVGEKLTVEENGSSFLRQKEYDSIDSAIKEILNYFMLEVIESNPHSVVSIITTTEKETVFQTKDMPYNGKMIRVLTDDTVQDLGDAKLVTDTKNRSDREIRAKNVIPIFLPKLTLGTSDAMPLMKIYLKLSTDRVKEEKIFRLNLERVIKSETISMVCELDNFERVNLFKAIQKKIINEFFKVNSESSDYKRVEKYILAKKEKRLFTSDIEAIKDVQQSDDWLNYVNAVNANYKINYIVKPNKKVIDAEFREARVYLDFEEHYNMLRHAKAVSNGIPIISEHRSDFIEYGKNGFYVTRDIKEINIYLDYFIDSLRNWNEALVYSVGIIEKYEPENIMNKWKEMMN